MNRFLRSFTVAALAGTMAFAGCNKDATPAAGEAAKGDNKAGAAAGPAKAAEAPAAATADAAIMGVMTGMMKGDPAPLWAFLPGSYQADVTALVHDFGGKLDAELYDKGFAVLGKAINVLKTKKDFILKSPIMAQAMQNPMLPPEAFQKNWDAVVEMLGTIATSELAKAASLKTLDVGAFVAGTGKKVMGQGLAIAKAMGQDPTAVLGAFKAEMVKTEGDKATLKLSAPGGGEGKMEEFVKVEGKWIPADMAADWKKALGELKGQLDAVPAQMTEAKPMAMAMLAQVEGTLDKLAAAGSQAEFDAAVMGAMAAMGGPGGAPGGAMQGDAPAGDAPAGDAPAGDAPAGDAPAGDAPAGDEAGE